MKTVKGEKVERSALKKKKRRKRGADGRGEMTVGKRELR